MIMPETGADGEKPFDVLSLVHRAISTVGSTVSLTELSLRQQKELLGLLNTLLNEWMVNQSSASRDGSSTQ
jgi:hypothetical protein